MGNFIVAHLPWFWVAVMVICILIETFTLSLTTVWFACGALVMVFLSFTGMPFRWQLLLFVLVSLALLALTRPFVVKKLKPGRTATNSDATIGKAAVVTEAIGALGNGAVKVGGLVWTARSADGAPIEAGKTCTVVSIEGATAVVREISPANEAEQK